eukprot:GSChrysophyteH1.ASY1.ANO1.289.1 assembled CDS
MMLLTLFVLFGDNVKLLSSGKEADFGFEVCNTICLFFFIAEFFAQCWSKTNWDLKQATFDGYFLCFYFWLDLLSILSMFPDISWIANGIGLGDISNSVQGNNAVTRTGRIIRLVRLVRLVRLYKIYLDKRRKMEQETEMMELMRAGEMSYDDILRQQSLYQERSSKLGSKLNDSITQRVITLVLTMVIILPLVSYTESNYSVYGSMDTLYTYVSGVKGSSSLETSLIGQVQRDFSAENTDVENPNLIYLKILPYSDDPVVDNQSLRSSLRTSATIVLKYGSEESGKYLHAEFDNNALLQHTAELNIGLTIFIGIMLVLGSAVFNNDAQQTVLTPIERMMNMVEAVVKDPLSPLHFDHSGPIGHGEYETRLLESTVEKITGLLRVDSGSKINPLLPGVRVYVIVGFCDIHHFEEVLVKLTDDVLVFVNHIAEIVHENVVHWGGQCNKNLGNAFVILWRIDDEERLHEVIDLRRVPGINIYADQALIGYLKIIAEINRSKAILKYRNEPRLTSNGTEHYKVSMGFGLHAGWAIEGAVGSMYKVDATYLSPHVNMAARLETSSRQYGVPILISHFVQELLSPEVQKKCRQIDVVTVKGSEMPVGIYTYDCLQDQIFKAKPEKEMKRKAMAPLDIDLAEGFMSANNQMQNVNKTSQKRSNQGTMIGGMNMSDEDVAEGFFLNNSHDTVEVFEMDDDLIMLRAHVARNEEFQTVFSEGIKIYLDGDWPAARKLLEKANKMMQRIAPTLGGDGPCLTLLNYMKERDNKAPKDWAGFRPLTAK